MASDALSVIMQDHRVLERLFERCRTDRNDRPALVAEIKVRLKAHSIAEEERVYTAVTQAAPDETDEVHHGVEEHREAEELLAAVEAADPDSTEFEAALEQFVEAIRHHVEEEENDILPTLEDSVDQERLEELGAAFTARRVEVLQAAGFADDAGAGAPDDLSSMSRTELYEQAKEADVPGRSQMNKDDLARALRE